jgi:hypothetical protein
MYDWKVLQFIFWLVGLAYAYIWCVQVDWWLSIILAFGLIAVSWLLGLVMPLLVLNWAAGARFGAAAGLIGVLVTANWANIVGAILMNIAAWFVVRGQALRLGID